MATLRKRGNSYELDWRDATGARHRESLGAVDKSTARAALTRKKLELIGNITGAMPVMTVAEFSVMYLNWYKMQYPSSYDRVSRIFKNYLVRDFGPRPMNTITPTDMTERMAVWSRKLKPPSVNKVLKCFKAMFNRAVEWKKLEENPIRMIKDVPEPQDKRPKFYTAAQLKDLYKVCSKRNKYMWKLIANTGLRRQEALNLRHSDVGTKYLTIHSTNESPTKGKETRDVPMNAQAKIAVKRLKTIVGDPEFVFPRIRPRSFARVFKRGARRAKLHGSLHTLRHSFGANLAMAGVPLRTIQVLMGHSSVETTEIYASLAPDYLKEMTSKIQL